VLRDKRASRYLELDPQEYYSDRWMAGFAAVASGGTAACTIDLFNDGKLGSPLLLYDFTISVPAAVGILVAPFKGHTTGALVAGIPLNPLQTQREGATSAQGGLVGLTFGYKIFVGTNLIYQWNHEWPIAEIAAGYSLRFSTDAITGNFSMSFLWLIEPDS